MVAGVLAVQCVTVSLAGYAFARLRFPGRDFLFYAFLLQLMLVPPALIVPNLRTVVDLGLYDTLPGVMAPYFASAFGTFLMRQTFLALPRDFEEAAAIDGAPWWAIIWYVLLPMAKPGLVAFAIVSITAHWNEFLWPLMVINEPEQPDADHRPCRPSRRAPRAARNGACWRPARFSSWRRWRWRSSPSSAASSTASFSVE